MTVRVDHQWWGMDGVGWLPPEAVVPNRTAVLVALVDVYERDGRATVRAVAAVAGYSVGTTHKMLTDLAYEDLVTWDLGRRGTLRPLVGHVGLR